MGRWTQYDEDDYRLPEDVKRVGYDADSGRYYFRDREGLMYKGPKGSRFGQLTLVSEIHSSIPQEVDEHSDLEAAPTEIIEPFYDQHITVETLSHHPTKILFEIMQAQGCQHFFIEKEELGGTHGTRCDVTVHDIILASATRVDWICSRAHGVNCRSRCTGGRPQLYGTQLQLQKPNTNGTESLQE
ncbi:hypothetical protein EDB19DRAFT_2037012 [Suillus lakei]|nr:hypothetical protein EDB19DRAFT_2037012 [Suillus lakei]